MILSGPEITRLIRTRAHHDGAPVLPFIEVTPFVPAHVGPNSLDLRLAPELLVYDTNSRVEEQDDGSLVIVRSLDARRENPTRSLTIPDDGLILQPGVLYLGSTMERVECHGVIPALETRSSIARLGISTHLSAGLGDDGGAMNWTLEITVVHPVKVYHSMRIAQMVFFTTQGERRPYVGRYVGSKGPVASRMWQDFEDQQ